MTPLEIRTGLPAWLEARQFFDVKRPSPFEDREMKRATLIRRHFIIERENTYRKSGVRLINHLLAFSNSTCITSRAEQFLDLTSTGKILQNLIYLVKASEDRRCENSNDDVSIILHALFQPLHIRF